MEILGILRQLGVPEWLFLVATILIVLQLTGLINPLKDGVRTLFNRSYASEQQTIRINDKLLNFVITTLEREMETNTNNSNRLEAIEKHIQARLEVEGDIDTYMHEHNEKLASVFRAIERQAKATEKMSRSKAPNQTDKGSN